MRLDWDAAADPTALAGTVSVAVRGRERGGLEGAPAARGSTESERVARLGEALALAKPALPPGEWPEVRRRIEEGARSGLAKLNEGARPSAFTFAEHVGLESVILTDGTRPSLFVRGGTIDLAAPDIGEWKGQLGRAEDRIRSVIRSVGRVDVPVAPGFAGTCFVLAEGLVLTNRHVLEAIAVENTPGDWVLKWPGDIRIDFVAEDGARDATAFKVTGVAFAGADQIAGTINFAHLDAAVLRVDPASDSGHRFPDPVVISADTAQPRSGRDLYAVGFPGKPMTWMFEGVPPSGFETAAVISSVFNAEFEVKRLSPGTVLSGPAGIAGDERGWIFAHDASTLGGSSGSCVADLTGGGLTVVGLHFGGLNRKQNWAHAVSRLQESLAPLLPVPVA
ncbi:serine protease [Enterovirga sp.]|uniref:trypsin-like serine peptidase n=1 Tax=Enterovirga sp. TaxID=2026350 RepID=UPI002C029FD9|nr:serine protease [Enterovirga sp.]HMO27849.1 serine protease [Enterovirga sp.]